MRKNITNPNAETDSMAALDNLTTEAYSLNDKMEQAIIRVVNEHGGLIRTDNEEYGTIYGYIYNEETYRVEEHKILALSTLEDNRLSILIGARYVIGMAPEPILKSEEQWYLVLGFWSNVLANATLLNICETLEEYIDNMLNDEDSDE